jgi:signal transduction histidine kinase
MADGATGRSGSETTHTALHLVAVLGLTALAASGDDVGRRVVVLVLAVPAAAAVLVRRRHPFALLGVAAITTLLATQVLLVPAMLNLGLRRGGRQALLGVAGAVAVLAVVAPRGERLISVDGVEPDGWAAVGTWALDAAAVVLVPYVIGAAIGVRRDLMDSYRARAEQAEAQRAARAASAVLLERTRIAREAHDVLGHKLALLSMQAGGLEVNPRADPAVIEAQARLIRESAGKALDDLRYIIGSLDTAQDALGADAGAPRPLTPQDVSGVAALVAQSRASGATVHLDDSGLHHPERLPPDASRAAHRIVRECLTNAHRHAAGAPVTVSLAGRSGTELVIEVRNPVHRASAAASGPRRTGRGLPGLRERARAVGGRFVADGDDAEFLVRAVLPWPDSRGEGA